jgi:cysteine synthase
MKVYSNITEMIGKTLLLRLERIAENRQVYAKCEFMNPSSIKDRPILQIIDDAEVEGGSNVSIQVVE